MNSILSLAEKPSFFSCTYVRVITNLKEDFPRTENVFTYSQTALGSHPLFRRLPERGTHGSSHRSEKVMGRNEEPSEAGPTTALLSLNRFAS